MMLRSCLVVVAIHASSAFLCPNPRPFNGGVAAVADVPSDGAGINGVVINGGGVHPLMSSTTPSDSTTDSALTSSLKKLLENLDGPDGGQQLWASSSAKWQQAIVDALPSATSDVATALQTAMSRPENQFAILMGKAEPFVANFPSDPLVDEDANTAWVECRLRHADTDALLVTMGISLVMDDKKERWLISALDWQDFRDAFYPGVSGREWLRAF